MLCWMCESVIDTILQKWLLFDVVMTKNWLTFFDSRLSDVG